MTESTLFEVKSNMQLDTDISTPGIVLFKVAYVNTVNTLREGNETAASIKPDDEDGWFMLWGCLSIGLALSALAMAEGIVIIPIVSMVLSMLKLVLI